MLVDSHCHLDFDVFDEDRAETIQRAKDAGIGTMVSICTHITRFERILRLTESDRNIWCSAGIHPHHVEEEPPITLEKLVACTQHTKVVGIGETGLDYYYEHSPRDLQRDSFRTHISAARKTGLPLIVHTRDADHDMAEILEDEMGKGAFTGVLHCFSSGSELAQRAIDIGFYISLSGIITFKNAEELRDIVRGLPTDRLLVETDSPFLSPIPHRGRRNEPSFVVHTAAKVAELKNLTLEKLSTISSDNFFRLFSKAERPVL